jgi:acyl-CoA synthetase (AMP-forming)/AMP-acid ligase II
MEQTQSKRGDLEFGTIPRVIQLGADRFGDHHAIEDSPATLTFSDLAARASDAARAFMAAGLERGDRVAIWAPNIWEWIVAALGIHSAGAALVPINTRFKGPEAAYVLNKSKARMLLTISGFLDTDYVAMLRSSGVECPLLERIVVLRGDTPAATTAWPDFVAEGAGVSAEDGEARADSVEPSDLCDVIFTSGTTGHPKGVLCTHGQTLRVFRDWSDIVGLCHADRYLIAMPFFHAFGYKAGWLSALMMGATIVPHALFDANAILERVGRDRISVLPGPPALYQTILAHPELASFDLSPLRLAVTGAAVIPVELIVRMREELSFDTVITGYGLTESTGVVTMCRYDDDPDTIAKTSGRAIPDVECRIVDGEGNELPWGESGEIVVRGYNVMIGYLDDPEQTAEAIDADGWLHTGDIGDMNEQGYVRITDRMKDMYIVGGFNAYPAEIEHVLMTHPSIVEAAVIGVPDERLGEVGLAFVVWKPGEALSLEELVAWSRERMANYKVPRHVKTIDVLPRNATGKVTKHVLRAKTGSR